MSLFVKKFGKYLRRSFNPSTSFNNYNKSDKVSSELKCYNCDRPGHFAADCNRPKRDDRNKRDDRRADDRYRKEERYKRNEEDDERTIDKSKDKSKDKFKERSNDRRMKTSSNKRFSRKHDRKVLVAEASTKRWADSDSDSSSSRSSSSDSEQEEVHCFMADQADVDENSPKLSENGKAGIGFSKHERFKPNWLKNRLDKDKAKASQKPFVPNQSWHNSRKSSSHSCYKGREILVEKDPIKGNPAQEHFFLICAEIDLLVALRAKVIDDVALFLNSFSLKKLATINIEEMCKKEELVLSWGETESPQEAIQRKSYILIKYREVLVRKFLESWRANFVPGQGSTAVDLKVIYLLTDLHLSILEELVKEARAHGLLWKKPCCSTIFEGIPRDRGAIIAPNNTHTSSRCWIRTMLYVNGEWIVEPCADRWVKIPGWLMRKRWADVCLEVVDFCASRRLLPIGSLQFCRSSSVVEPVFQVASGQSPIFAFRVSQFCSIFVDFSVFNWFPSADISDFLSTIALDRTALRSLQRSFAASVVPSVQLSLDQCPSSPTTADSSSSLRFDTSDVDATASSLPHVSQDVSAALADLQVILSEQINESQSGISSKLHKIEQSFRDSLSDQAALFKSLSQEARQEGRSMNDVQTMRFNEFRKTILAQNASIFVGLADVHKEVQEVNAKVDIMASRFNVIQKDAEATKEAPSHQLLEFQSQAQENQNILHAQLSELVDYIHRGSADKKGESGSRGLQQHANVQVSASAERTPTFAQRVEMAQRHIVHTVLDADANRALLERQAAAECDRERRRREARMLKRRRRD
ncbi:hypothetical protein F511_25719 [Dorcoceras hygrometricum]|uniref:CCHC-type domain-containing protein n=1 Tax=Dorcoceras hygrometricum TaxID=472368 RepID=A0A2Z7DEV5_9LAMI|nr:hypothetical protein F511_25719 [Dorcoceras hygrometricum]